MQKESITHLFFENISSIPPPLSEDEKIAEFQTKCLRQTSTLINGSVYVIDFHKQCFYFVSDHDLFLSGFSPDDVLKMNYDFFSKIVHPDDLQLFIDIHRAILQYLSDPDSNCLWIDYFAFNVRLQNHGLPLMVYHKISPLFINGYARMAICHLSSSVIHKSGNLGIFFGDRKKYSLYSFKKQQWMQKEQPYLTSREKDILKLAKQGKNSKEIAEILCVSGKTIRNTETSLYQKLDVHSVLEAVIFATNHRMIFV
jgi:DNA-binding CsgD family transcriptional regulator